MINFSAVKSYCCQSLPAFKGVSDNDNNKQLSKKGWNPEYRNLKGKVINQKDNGEKTVLLENGEVIKYKVATRFGGGLERQYVDSHGRKVSEVYNPTPIPSDEIHKFSPDKIVVELKSGEKIVCENPIGSTFYLLDKNGYHDVYNDWTQK